MNIRGEPETFKQAIELLYKYDYYSPKNTYSWAKEKKLLIMPCNDGCSSNGNYKIQDHYDIKSPREVYDVKLNLVMKHANLANSELKNYGGELTFLNYLSGANGWYGTGLTAGGRKSWQSRERVWLWESDSACARNRLGEGDLPRTGGACWGPGWICGINLAGINEMFARRVIEDLNYTNLGVIIADFPGPQLAEAVQITNQRYVALYVFAKWFRSQRLGFKFPSIP